MDALPSNDFLRAMPKVELHVHIEGSIRPETVLKLAERHGFALPAQSVEGLQDWYTFRDFEHFVEVYVLVSRCVRTPEDIELVFREFLQGQREQNILHTEATYTACTIEKYAGIPFDEQLDALSRARAWGEKELGVSLGVILDIVRGDTIDRAAQVLEWTKQGLGCGVVALGLAGREYDGTKQYAPVLEEARRQGVPLIAHAGETCGAQTVWDVLECGAVRVGHGVRCFEDPALVAYLAETQIHLEVCPTSNVCLGVFPSFEEHPLRQMVEEGLNVSVNSDDPPMFSTSLTEEWAKSASQYSWGKSTVKKLTMNAVDAALTDGSRRDVLECAVNEFFEA
ncbi:MAG: adenosine deaminase [Armatimonadetes bacterium]|nr:adenosine deaminase [Armatimonadota bacterium]